MLTILSGPARSGKTERLLSRYRDAIVQGLPGSVLWISPTWRAAADVRQRLFDGVFRGCFAPGVMTFEKFAESVLHGSGLPIRPMTRLMKRELVRQIFGEQSVRGRLKHFQSIVNAGGLVDLVCEFIGELKRLEIWPEDFSHACSARGLSDKDIELAEIYDRYQQVLRESGLFDAEGRFWSARDVLQKKEGESPYSTFSQPEIRHTSSPFHRFLVLDGFTDFTRTQHEIIEILAKRAETTIISLPLEPEPRRTDLFAKSLKTLAELQRRHSNLRVEEISRPAAVEWPTMRHLEQLLFVNPRRREHGTRDLGLGNEFPTAILPEPRCSGIEILAAARPVGEMELIAGRIKRLLVDGEARPGEIAVVFRSPLETGGLLGEVFHRSGIPFVFESGNALDRSPALQALVSLLTLDLDDWPFDQLLAVLGNNYFRPNWCEWKKRCATADVERMIRYLQVPRGRKKLIEQLNQKGGGRKAEGGGNRGERREKSSNFQISISPITLAIVEHLAGRFDALPERATLSDWAKAWQQLAKETGLLRVMEDDHGNLPERAEEVVGGQRSAVSKPSSIQHSSNPESPIPNPQSPFLSDLLAWNRLMEVLAAGDTLAEWLQRQSPELDRREALEALLDILRSERIGHAGDESGYVRMLSASSIRSLRIPYLFLAGLSEKAFPPPDRDDRLYSEAEYARLIEAGLPLVARTERTREEMLLFYEAITRASKRLYLSYPALDESAQPLLPSPFLREVEDVFGQGRIPRVERADLRPIPPDDEPISNAEFRVKAFATAMAGNVALLAGLLGERGAEGREKGAAIRESVPSSPFCFNLLSGLELIHLRQDRDRFGPAEGVLQSSEARAFLAAKFPMQRVFSATELERYASCPFRYYLERILNVQPVEDLALEFDVLNRGRITHDVLKKFHENVNQRLGRAASPLELDSAEFDSLMATAIQESMPPESSNPVQAALAEVDRRLVVQWMSHYRSQYEKYETLWRDFDAMMRPELFEISFGQGQGASPSTSQTLDFIHDGQSVRVAGRIDRIDTGIVSGKNVVNILDYKTSGSLPFTPESIRAGTTLQLPLYALAAVELLLVVRNVLPWQAGYWYVREGGFRPRQSLRMYRENHGQIELESAWEELRDELGDIVSAIVRAIRRGQFPVCSTDEHCTGRCPYNTICRINQARSLEKTCQPTADE